MPGTRTIGLDSNMYRDIYTSVSTEWQSALQRIDDPGVWKLICSMTQLSGRKERFPFSYLLSSVREFKDTRVARQIGADDYYIDSRKWEHTLEIDQDDIDDNALGWLPGRVAEMAGQAQLHKDELVSTLLNEHIAGSLSTTKNGFDGTTLISATHAWADGYTTAQSNLLSGSGNGTIDGSGDADVIENAIRTAKAFKGPDGKRLKFRPTHVFTALDIEGYWYRAFGSDTLIAGTNTAESTNYNILMRHRLTIVPVDDLTNGYWAIADLSQGIKPLIFANRQDWTVSDTMGGDDHFNTDKYKIGMKARYDVLAGFWPRIIAGDAT